jgi:hypothetical protein
MESLCDQSEETHEALQRISNSIEQSSLAVIKGSSHQRRGAGAVNSSLISLNGKQVRWQQFNCSSLIPQPDLSYSRSLEALRSKDATLLNHQLDTLPNHRRFAGFAVVAPLIGDPRPVTDEIPEEVRSEKRKDCKA